MTKLVVGCPTQNRTWILPLWKDYVEKAAKDFDLSFLFVVPQWDAETLDLISIWDNAEVIISDEPERSDTRPWANKDSYHHMADLRNTLLRRIREIYPDVYLSLDSDILIHEDAINNMFETMQANKANAVSSLTYLDQVEDSCTNLGIWKNGHVAREYRRVTQPGIHKVDIIMAIQMMDNLAYNVNYEYHDYGEDFGWCQGLRRANAIIFCDGRTKSKHVMTRKYLDKIDPRVGY